MNKNNKVSSDTITSHHHTVNSGHRRWTLTVMCAVQVLFIVNIRVQHCALFIL